MTQPVFRAPDTDHIVPEKWLLRDVRPWWKQILDIFQGRIPIACVIVACGLTPFFASSYIYLSWMIGVLVYGLRARSCKNEGLTFRMPANSRKTDYNDPKPGRTGFFRAGGVFMLGNEFGANMSELWLGIRDTLTHLLVFGTTGSGKTEALVSLSFNAIAMGSGFFYVDPKAAPKLQAQIYIMARMCGRDDDFRTINYLSIDKRAEGRKDPRRTTNTINPFSSGSADALSTMLNALIPASEGSNSIFSQNAMNIMSSLMYCLVEMRDRGEILLSAEAIRQYIDAGEAAKLAEREDFSLGAKSSLRSALGSLGWQRGVPPEKQPRNFNEQFSYARAYFGRVMGSLTDIYGHIYKTTMGEVDMSDVVMNRRICVVLLPALAVAPEDLKNLGKITLSSIRIAISVGLGDGREGVFKDTLKALPTDAPAPFLSITDEYAAIPTPGYVEVLTQGRGLGIAAIVASQDYAGITKADKEGAQQLLENTKVKLFMKTTSASETWELAQKLAGQVNVMETGGMAIKPEQGMLSADYRDQMNATPRERSKIKLEDLMDQVEGEFHAFFGSKMVRGMTFYADPPLRDDGKIRINQMLKVVPPERRFVDIRFGRTSQVVDKMLALLGNLPEKADRTDAEDRVAQEYQDRAPKILAETRIDAVKEVLAASRMPSMETWISVLVRLQVLEGDSLDAEPLSNLVNEDPFENMGDDGDDFTDNEEIDTPDAALQRVRARLDNGDMEGDLARVAELVGMDRESARRSSQNTVNAVRSISSIVYPKSKPQSSLSRRDALADALDSMMTKITKNT